MTQRERDIYMIIKNEPMISQNDIAARLRITRSAVSAYILTMIKKGIIKGRGYIINSDGYPLLLGPGHIDIVSVCEDEVSRPGLYDSIKTTLTYGGAIKNVAQYLARLECNPHAIFTATADFFGAHFLDDCKVNGIDVDDSLVLNDAAMPIYNEITRENGSVIAAANLKDNLAYRITPEFLKTKEAAFRGAAQIVLPSTLSRDAIEYITSAFGDSTLIYYAIYYHDAVQHISLLPRFHTVVLSYPVAFQFVNSSHQPASDEPSATDVKKVCLGLRALGIKNAMIFISLYQSCLLTQERCVLQTTRPKAVHDRSSYRFFRDVSVASTAYAIQLGFSPEESLHHLAASKLIATSSASYVYSKYCQALVESTLGEMESICLDLSL